MPATPIKAGMAVAAAAPPLLEEEDEVAAAPDCPAPLSEKDMTVVEDVSLPDPDAAAAAPLLLLAKKRACFDEVESEAGSRVPETSVTDGLATMEDAVEASEKAT